MRPLWLLINLLQGLWGLLWTALWISMALLAYLVTRSRKPGLFFARRIWAPGILIAGPARLEVHGLERLDRSQPYLFTANHQSFLDIAVLFGAVPVPLLFLGKIELARVPFVGWYMKAMGMVFIDRGDKEKSAASVERMRNRLQEGWSLLSFPEGTRSPDGRVQRFRGATFAAAIDTGVPVVPVAIDGAARVFPRNGIGGRPGTIRVTLCEPIPTQGLTSEDRNDLAGRTQRAVEAVLETRNP